jgi:hypothetical protein
MGRGNRGCGSTKCAYNGWTSGGVWVVLVPKWSGDLFFFGGDRRCNGGIIAKASNTLDIYRAVSALVFS